MRLTGQTGGSCLLRSCTKRNGSGSFAFRSRADHFFLVQGPDGQSAVLGEQSS
jgi:hypothetical protein